MIITYYGTQFVKFQVGELTVAANPVSKASSAKSGRFGADIALVSLKHPDFDGTGTLSHGNRAPFVVSGPGEYEVRGIPIRGFGTPAKYGGKKDGINTLYYFTLDNIGICFLGALHTPSIDEAILEKISSVDILFAPIGGGEVLDPQEAYKVSLLFNPSIIIPLHYGAQSLKKFLDEASAEGVTAEEKCTVKKKDIEGKEADVVVLKPLL